MPPFHKYRDIEVEVTGQIGIIKLNRPEALNAFSSVLMSDVISAIRELDEHSDTVFTVLTGKGRFFSAGVDVKGEEIGLGDVPAAEKKVRALSKLARATEMLRLIIDHKKVFVLALNGPGVGGGAAWFQGVADIVLAAEGAWMQVPFSALGLVPENGSAINFAQSMGVHRANDFLMFGRKLTAEELEQWGLVNRIFPANDFHKRVVEFLEDQLAVNDGKSMMETKRLQNAPLRDGRIIALFNSIDALAERIVEDAPTKRFMEKKKELKLKSKGSKL
ncbi:hypothetical protein VC83_09241 [Pseudogymnoascus destructans]|uniref:Enoyl-CoA hydratase n=2 Tax=Pseudogymnoascus destructans TaxID=655981 RepID=L8G0R5_PSED2|nr:uncharacterized protein VC83_09241 [Pseudogymnoascus destructans]ELR05536.1 hypothetical protein GMDG_07456 [Pseudogymnoascus destructans 20631-21]OAF54434.1 hypothetical protein VC83_09241 [Pseudogymnoascus destructans]